MRSMKRPANHGDATQLTDTRREGKKTQREGNKTQLEARRRSVKGPPRDGDATVSDATQPTDTDAPETFAYPTGPSIGHLSQYSICYPCGRRFNHILKNVQCAMCKNKQRTLFLVTSPEFWRPQRQASSCCRCQCEGKEGFYWLTQSEHSPFNRPVCCQCYSVESPPNRGMAISG